MNGPLRFWLLLVCLVALTASGCGGDSSSSGDSPRESEVVNEGGGGKADTLAGPIASFQCKAQENFVRRGDFVTIEVDARDARGNASRNYAVVATPPNSVRVVQRNKVIFDADGVYEIECISRDSEVMGATSVRVGTQDPALRLNAPTFVEGSGEITVSGSAFTASGSRAEVTINGSSVSVDEEGSFQVVLNAEEGLNQFTAVAKDERGRTTERNEWTLAGDFGDLHEITPDVAQVKISNRVYGELSELFSRILTAHLKTEEFREQFLADKVDDEDYRLYPEDLVFDGPEMVLEAQDGAIGVTLKIRNLRYFGEVETHFLFGWSKRDFEVKVETLTLRATLGVHGPSDLRLTDTALEHSEIELNLSSLPGFVEDILVDLATDGLAEKIAGDLEEKGNEALGGVFDGFSQEHDLDLPEPLLGSLQGRIELSSLSADEGGVHVGLGATFDGDTDPWRADAPGPWKLPGGSPTLPGEQNYEVAFSADMLNKLFFAAWQVGGMDMVLTPDAPELSDEMFQASSLDIFLDPSMPPVIRPGEEAGTLKVQFAGLRADIILETNLGVFNIALQVYAEGVIGVGTQDGEVVTTFEVSDIQADVLVAPANLEPEPMRRYLEQVVSDKVLPKLAELAESLPIPEAQLDHLGVEGVSVLRIKGLTPIRVGGSGGLGFGGQIEIE